MMRGIINTTFWKDGKHCIGAIPYTVESFGGPRQYDWHGAKYHKVGNKRQLTPTLADMKAMARYLDNNYAARVKKSPATRQLNEQMLPVVTGEKAA